MCELRKTHASGRNIAIQGRLAEVLSQYAPDVAVVIVKSPLEPFVVTAAVLVTGPVHSMSKLQCAPAETGVSNRNSAFGMSKKSLTARLAMLMVALPLPSSTGPSVGLGTVPPRFGS